MSTPFPSTIFVLGTGRDIGKTVTCVGIIESLLTPDYGYKASDIGYMKPVGQQTVTVIGGQGVPVEVDKDAVLLTSLEGLQSHGYRDASPVVWQGGVTAQFIDDASTQDPHALREGFLERIRQAYQRICVGKRIVIVEGTGQPGVGSVAGVSNADVINALRAMGVPVYVAMVTEGGIGSTIDEVFPYLMALDHMDTRVDGMIVNGVIPSKVDKIRHYLETYYTKIMVPLYGEHMELPPPPILGFVPTIEELRWPSMRLLAETFARKKDSAVELVAPHDFDTCCQLIRRVKVISLEFGYGPLLEPGEAVIVGVNSNDVILEVLLRHDRLLREHGAGLAGLILSCKDVGGLAPQIRELIESGTLPTMVVGYDSARIVNQIETMTVKIQPYDAIKRELISKQFRAHLELWRDLPYHC
jgi:hypothetical protein